MEHSNFLGGGGHLRIRDYYGIQDAFKFAFVRNPWDRFISAYFCLPNAIFVSHGSKEAFNKFVQRLMSFDFSDWRGDPVISYPGDETATWPIHHHFLPQWYFLLDSNGRVDLDFVGRFENLQEDWRYVCDKVGVRADLAHHRQSRHEYYKSYYTLETWEFVGNLYQRDVELFNYQDSVLEPGRQFAIGA